MYISSMRDKQHTESNANLLTLSTLHTKNNNKMEISTTERQEFNRKIFQRVVDNMTMEEIEIRSLLVSMSASTEENILFQQVLTNEYNNRKKQ